MFVKTADIIAQRLKDSNTIDDEHYEICRYGLQQGFIIILNIVSTVAVGVVFGMLWQAVFFTAIYIPLRSYAGGYHANTALRCYIYSILLMIAVLLAIRHITITGFICIIILVLSFSVIAMVAPVEDLNKPLDKMEKAVYKKRTIIISTFEGLLLLISLTLNLMQITYCIVWAFILMATILLIGKSKNRMCKL